MNGNRETRGTVVERGIRLKKRIGKNGCIIFEQHLNEQVERAVKKGKHGLREICGVIVSNGCCLELVPIRNATKRPASFWITNRSWYRAKRAAKKMHHRVVGTFHSHPISGPVPGDSDIKGGGDDLLMLIIDCTHRDVKLWHLKKGKATEVTLQRIKLPLPPSK